MQTSKNFKRSDEPIWWRLFSGGGVCFAVFLPSVILFFGLLLLLGIVSLDFATASSWFFGFWGLVFIGAAIAMPAFHGLHRIRHCLYDFKFQSKQLIKVFCMGLAALISALCLLFWLRGII